MALNFALFWRVCLVLELGSGPTLARAPPLIAVNAVIGYAWVGVKFW